jgi:hypothetical protein
MNLHEITGTVSVTQRGIQRISLRFCVFMSLRAKKLLFQRYFKKISGI